MRTTLYVTPHPQILRKLQQNERLPERSRQRLRLREYGLQGLVACLPEGAASPQLCQGLYRLFLGAGTTWVGPGGRSGGRAIRDQETGQVDRGRAWAQGLRLGQQGSEVPRLCSVPQGLSGHPSRLPESLRSVGCGTVVPPG